MNERIWESIVHTAIAGTERNPLPETVSNQLALPPATDPAQGVMQALAAANLLRKSAAALPLAPAPLPEPCPPDTRQLCPENAVQDLLAMLRGVFPEVLPEFFELLASGKRRLPPETLPDVLDHFNRQRHLPEPVQVALGPAGGWLAAQHPEWPALFDQPEQGAWGTGSFGQRLRLLEGARHTRPLVGLAWLEKSWSGERAEHKVRFLDVLRTGLSAADETLLERAATDKSRAVRLEALRLLMLLPESRVRQESRILWQQKRSAKPGQLVDFLEKILPTVGLFSSEQLSTLATGIGPMATREVLLRLIPPGDLAEWSDMSPEGCLNALSPFDSLLSALLDSIVMHRNPDWTNAVLRFFDQQDAHPLWTSEVLKNLFGALPEATWQAAAAGFCRHDRLLDMPDLALIHTLRHSIYPWPKNLLYAVLSFPARSEKPRNWQPPAHLLQVLKQAALRCRPEDAESIEMPDGKLPYAWHSQLLPFRATTVFRRRMREHLQGRNN